jgi:hypothetical protein
MDNDEEHLHAGAIAETSKAAGAAAGSSTVTGGGASIARGVAGPGRISPWLAHKLAAMQRIYDSILDPQPGRGKYDAQKRKAAKKLIAALFPGDAAVDMTRAEIWRIVEVSQEFKSLPDTKKPGFDTVMRAANKRAE